MYKPFQKAFISGDEKKRLLTEQAIELELVLLVTVTLKWKWEF